YYYYKLALNIYMQMNSTADVQLERMNLGKILRVKKQYEIAEKYLREAFNYFDSVRDIKYAFGAAEELSMLYKDRSDFKNAYKYNVISQKYKDTIDSKKRTDSIAKMFAQYETEKKDRAIQ